MEKLENSGTLPRLTPTLRPRGIKNACACLTLLVSVLCLSTCKHKATTDEIVQQWLGKTIQFPENSGCLVLGESLPCSFNFASAGQYKILLYTDSTGCTSCKLRLDLWDNLMREADTTVRGKVEFLFYFYPKNKHELHDAMKRENFKEQVYVNEHDELNRLNKFSTNMDYQCFLLDKNDQVVSVGNPALNPAVWELDKKIINGQLKASTEDN